jgi:hypothetical protein
MPTAARKRAQAKYNSKPEQIKKREARNKARYQMIKEGKAKKGDGKDVMHVDGHALHNVRSNWKMGSKKQNRSYPRTKNAHKKNPND